MKKLSIVLFSLFGVSALVACSSGSSSSSGSPSECPNGSVSCGTPDGVNVESYSAVFSSLGSNTIESIGGINTSTGLYLANNESSQLIISVINNNGGALQYNFTVQGTGTNLPIVTPTTFTTESAESTFVLTINPNGATAGEYSILPSVSGAAPVQAIKFGLGNPIDVNFPKGTYQLSGNALAWSHNPTPLPPQGSVLVVYDYCVKLSTDETSSNTIVNTSNGVYSCGPQFANVGDNQKVCRLNAYSSGSGLQNFPLPSGNTRMLPDGNWIVDLDGISGSPFMLNANWNSKDKVYSGSETLYSYSHNYSLPDFGTTFVYGICNQYSSISLKYVNSSERLPYPIAK